MRAALALNRFGLGARVGEAAQVEVDPQGWLLAQLRSAPSAQRAAEAPRSQEITAQWLQLTRQPDSAMMIGQHFRRHYVADLNARLMAACSSEQPFRERLVHFWSNHFAVSADRAPLAMLAGSFEEEAIRPHVLGRFTDMLLAVETHPAMLLFLDQARAIGPSSPVARRVSARGDRAPGLNENLGREILELHTLGVRGGYEQADVLALSRALTGWSVNGLMPRLRGFAAEGAFVYIADIHEPGDCRLLGQTFPDTGLEQGRAMLQALARHPATARHIAGKLVRHFVADQPPADLVDRLARVFLDSEGDLGLVAAELVTSPHAWTRPLAKFKTPWEFAVSSLRALGATALAPRPEGTGAVFTELGQRIWTPGSPAGYADTASRWAAPDALYKRVALASVLARRHGADHDARDLARQILPGAVGEATLTEIARAESPVQAIALMLASPEFQRR